MPEQKKQGKEKMFINNPEKIDNLCCDRIECFSNTAKMKSEYINCEQLEQIVLRNDSQRNMTETEINVQIKTTKKGRRWMRNNEVAQPNESLGICRQKMEMKQIVALLMRVTQLRFEKLNCIR